VVRRGRDWLRREKGVRGKITSDGQSLPEEEVRNSAKEEKVCIKKKKEIGWGETTEAGQGDLKFPDGFREEKAPVQKG